MEERRYKLGKAIIILLLFLYTMSITFFEILFDYEVSLKDIAIILFLGFLLAVEES